MSKLRERLEEGKQSVPSINVIEDVWDIVYRAESEALDAALRLKDLRKTTKAYRGKELKAMEDMARKFQSSLKNLRFTIDDDKDIARGKE